jgi:CheY-like chemotaxis protein
MKLDYNIIWIDDKIDAPPYKAIVKEVRDHVNDQFFNCIITPLEDYDDFKSNFNNNIQYDLIITDLSLNNGSTGKQVIDYLREEKHNQTEVLFYSANSNFRDTALINNNRITFYQLVTETSYRDLSKEVFELIDLTISKFQHIVAMRGMIMNETSTLDVQFTNLLKLVLIGKEQAIEKIKKRYKKFNDENNAEIETCLDLDILLHQIGASHRWKGLKENIEKNDLQKKLEDYEKEIIIIRNKFAHAVLEKDEKGREFFRDKKDGINFNEEKCQEIRKKIIEHKSNLDKLQSILS